MGDIESDPLAGDAGGGEAAGADEAIDPVKAAEADAWLAQFRADNAAKVMQHNFEEAEDAQAEARAESAKRDYELGQAKKLTDTAAQLRAEAAALEEKAKKDAARHDEYEAQAEFDRHMADSAEAVATELQADAAAANQEAARLEAESKEIYTIFQQHQDEYRILQEQAVAAQRIATNEARLQHAGDAASGDASEAAGDTTDEANRP
jgi:chromosome segregation ATPase